MCKVTWIPSQFDPYLLDSGDPYSVKGLDPDRYIEYYTQYVLGAKRGLL